MYHLTTHAFFKATLFLVAGSIIHACHHEQDIYKMGGIFSRMPITSIVALLATFSIIAIPYFSGYYSKEAIVVAAYTRSAGGAFIYQAAFWIIFAAAALTPIYMFRLFFNVFCGTPHSECAANARESSLWMTFPLVVLAVYSVFGAWGFAYESQWLDGKFSFIMPTAAVKFVSGLLPLHSPTPEIEGNCGARRKCGSCVHFHRNRHSVRFVRQKPRVRSRSKEGALPLQCARKTRLVRLCLIIGMWRKSNRESQLSSRHLRTCSLLKCCACAARA